MYQHSRQCSSGRHYASRQLVGALLLTCVAWGTGCTTPKRGYEETFEQLWDEFDAMYGGFELRDVDWDDAYDRYRPKVNDDMSDEEFYDVITDMLAETDDGHVHVIAPGRQVWSANHFYHDEIGYDRFDLDLVREEYLDDDFETNDYDWYTLGELEDGSTYLHLQGIDDSTQILSTARKRADKSGKLVIDLRHNRGGDMTWVFWELGAWTSKDLTVSYNRTRNGPERDDFGDWYESKLLSRGEDIDFDIVVLIDRFTISAGERMVLALERFDVTFVGEPTNGSVATSVGREMLNGWYYTLATQEILNPDRKTTIEGIGRMPDVYVENDVDAMDDGIDAALDEAMRQLE